MKDSARREASGPTSRNALVAFFQANPVEMYYRSFRTMHSRRASTSPSRRGSSGRSHSPRRGHIHHLLGGQGALEQLAPATAIRLGDDDGNP